MTIYNLDYNEKIDTFTINGKEYEIGDIPINIIEEISKIKVGFLKKDLIGQWRPICEKILKIRNTDVDITTINNQKLFALIEFIKLRIEQGHYGE